MAKQLPHGRETRGSWHPLAMGGNTEGAWVQGGACVARAGVCDGVGAGGASLSNVPSLSQHCPPQVLERGVTPPPKGFWESEQLCFPRQVGTTLSQRQFPLHLPRSPHSQATQLQVGEEVSPARPTEISDSPLQLLEPEPSLLGPEPTPFLARPTSSPGDHCTHLHRPPPPPIGGDCWMQGPPLLTPAPHLAVCSPRGRQGAPAPS